MGRRWQKVLGILCSFVSLFLLLRLYTKQTNNRSWCSWQFVFHFCVHTFKFCSFALNNKETCQNTLQLLVMFHSSSLFISFSLSVCLSLSLSLSFVPADLFFFFFATELLHQGGCLQNVCRSTSSSRILRLTRQHGDYHTTTRCTSGQTHHGSHVPLCTHYYNKDLSRLLQLSPGMQVNAPSRWELS